MVIPENDVPQTLSDHAPVVAWTGDSEPATRWITTPTPSLRFAAFWAAEFHFQTEIKALHDFGTARGRIFERGLDLPVPILCQHPKVGHGPVRLEHLQVAGPNQQRPRRRRGRHPCARNDAIVTGIFFST
jgi:hypothetical protein